MYRSNLNPYIFNMTLYRNIPTYLIEFSGSNASFINLTSGLGVPDDVTCFTQVATSSHLSLDTYWTISLFTLLKGVMHIIQVRT
jgi:hypothetical protein